MAGISAVSISSAPLSSAAQEQPGALETEKSLSVDMSQVRDTGKSQANAGADAAADEEPAHIKQLRQMIQKLQKQLAEQLKHLQEIAASNMDETLKAAAVAAAQAAVGATMASIATATAALLKALTENGGSSSGALLSTSA